MRVLGIDEAGRGCVLGDMVVAGFVVDGVSDELLRQAGAEDSKMLSPARRVAARGRLAALGPADVRCVIPAAIDEGNMNVLEEELIVALVRHWEPDVVIVDALGHPRSLPRVIARIRAAVACPKPQQWIMEPKADHTYAVVGAASIFAKTTRDAALEDLKVEFGDLGSGYPSDPVTKRWLARWAGSGRPWPHFVRTRWGTIRMLGQTPLFA